MFDSPTEKFNPEKHAVAFEFQQGSLLRKELDGITVEIFGVADASLSITQVTDVKIGSVNGDTQERICVDVSDIVSNMPSELMIVILGLAKGTYRIEVVTQYSTGGNLLKEPRTATFERTLTVQ